MTVNNGIVGLSACGHLIVIVNVKRTRLAGVVVEVVSEVILVVVRLHNGQIDHAVDSQPTHDIGVDLQKLLEIALDYSGSIGLLRVGVA